MAHYALLDSNNIVVQIITGVDETVTQIDPDGNAIGGSTEAWESFYASQPWFSGLTCKRTSYNAKGNGFRKNYAGIGYSYHPIKDAFIPPQCHVSAILNETTCQWECNDQSHTPAL